VREAQQVWSLSAERQQGLWAAGKSVFTAAAPWPKKERFSSFFVVIEFL